MTVSLSVNGRLYEGWRSVGITRTIEAGAGAFDLEITDKWSGQSVAWPIVEEDECSVQIDGETVITGWVGMRSQAINARQRSFAVSGKDKAGALVECSAILDRWSFKQTTALEIARTVAAGFGISVKLQPGLSLPTPLRKIAVNPGETAWDVIQRAAEASGLLVVSDGVGGLTLTRSGTDRASELVEGFNVMTAAVSYNAAERFRRYVVLGHRAGDDESTAGALRIRGEATDEGVTRTDRVLLLRPQRGLTRSDANRLADWNARNRAAMAEMVTVTVQGWRQSNGDLWSVNTICPVRVQSIGVEGDLLISTVNYSLSEGGEVTELQLVRPDAFAPDPSSVVAPAKFKRDRGS